MSNQSLYSQQPQAFGAPMPGQSQGPGQAGMTGYPGTVQGQPAMMQFAQGGYGAAGYGQGGYTTASHQGYAGYPAASYHQSQYQSSTPFFNFSNDRFLKGLLIGAAAAYLLTNESVQRTAIKGVVKAWSMLQGGVEEIKERFQDAEAEIRAGEAAPKE